MTAQIWAGVKWEKRREREIYIREMKKRSENVDEKKRKREIHGPLYTSTHSPHPSKLDNGWCVSVKFASFVPGIYAVDKNNFVLKMKFKAAALTLLPSVGPLHSHQFPPINPRLQDGEMFEGMSVVSLTLFANGGTLGWNYRLTQLYRTFGSCEI